MKVALVCDVLGRENNGTTIAAMNLARSLRDKGHEVHILCPDADKAGEAGYFVVPTLPLGPFAGYVEKNGVSLAKPQENIILSAIRGVDVVHVMVPFTLGLHAARLARELGIPLSAGFHAMAENVTTHLRMQDFAPANRLTYAAFSHLYRQCDAIHYPTQFLRDLYERLYGPTNGYVISNGVSSDVRPQPAQRPAAWENRFLILSTGRYSREKSQHVLIEAIARSAHRESIQLILAGSGPLKEQLMRQAEQLPVQPEFAFYERSEMLQVLNFCDLYVHPAEIEAEGIACLEAITCGLVPVISDSPRCATQAYALDERSLFTHGNAEDLARRIDWWIEHPAERAEYSARYRAYAAGRFDRAVCMDRMEQMLQDVAAGRKGGDPRSPHHPV